MIDPPISRIATTHLPATALLGAQRLILTNSTFGLSTESAATHWIAPLETSALFVSDSGEDGVEHPLELCVREVFSVHPAGAEGRFVKTT